MVPPNPRFAVSRPLADQQVIRPRPSAQASLPRCAHRRLKSRTGSPQAVPPTAWRLLPRAPPPVSLAQTRLRATRRHSPASIVLTVCRALRNPSRTKPLITAHHSRSAFSRGRKRSSRPMGETTTPSSLVTSSPRSRSPRCSISAIRSRARFGTALPSATARASLQAAMVSSVDVREWRSGTRSPRPSSRIALRTRPSPATSPPTAARATQDTWRGRVTTRAHVIGAPSLHRRRCRQVASLQSAEGYHRQAEGAVAPRFLRTVARIPPDALPGSPRALSTTRPAQRQMPSPRERRLSYYDRAWTNHRRRGR